MTSSVVRHGIFVASTNDLAEERNALVQAIVRWNDLHWDDGIAYTPLMWELSAAADAKVGSTHEAIQQQLGKKASGLIAIFKHRLGSGGTCRELDDALARDDFPTAVFFSDADVPNSLMDEAQELRKWRKRLPGHSVNYERLDDLGQKLTAQLDHWAKKVLRGRGATALVEEMQDPADYRAWLHTCNPQKEPCTLLLYNVELETFRTREQFSRYWGQQADEEHVRNIVLLLSPYKMRRLQRYLGAWDGPFPEHLHGRFFACGFASSGSGVRRVASSTAFCLLRRSTHPGSGDPIAGARIFTLSEPFSEPRRGSEEPDIVWDYMHSFLTENERVLRALVDIWDEGFNEQDMAPLEELQRAAAAPAPSVVIHPERDAPGGNTGEATVPTVKLLREKLFDPNVPSYLLDKRFYLLDWNPAFEMVFPTHAFYRREHVKEFVSQLDNSSEVTKRGARFEQAEITWAFDMEPMLYCSPRYRDMKFTKLASRVNNEAGMDIGWIVALQVNSVEAFALYEEDLRRMNETQCQTSAYAKPYANIMKHFPPYLDLVELCATALSSCQMVLDIGCGPGELTARLLEAGKRVTAIDSNDAMLEIAAERNRVSRHRLSLVKANAETLHAPNFDYDAEKIGVYPNYDGVALLNSLHMLEDPVATLSRIRRELLQQGATLAMSLPTKDTNLDIVLREIQSFGLEYKRRTGKRPWSQYDYTALTRVNRELSSSKILTRHSESFETILKEAGFGEIETVPCYLDQGIFVVAKAV